MKILKIIKKGNSMGMFDKLKKAFAPKPEPKATKETAKSAPKKSAKETATEKGEAYVTMLSMDIDPANLGQGAFELDWNEKFVADLVRHGYMMNPNDTDADIVDRWFTDVCRNVVLETWEQEQAMNPTRVVKSRDIGDGRSEVS
jgi:hypothetical protein